MKSSLAAAVAFLILLTAGCAADGNPDPDGDGFDFWGNPVPSASKSSPSCPVPVYEEPFPQPEPGALSLRGRPIETPEGWGWMVFYFEVLGLAGNGEFMDNRFCLPIDVHVYGKADGVDLQLLNPMGVVVQPEQFSSTTPWFGRFSIQFDPYDPAFAGRAPSYEIHLDVAYAPERDIEVTQPPIFLPGTKASGLGCRIATDLTAGWESKNTQAVAQDIGLFPAKTTATCVFRSNKFNYHG